MRRPRDTGCDPSPAALAEAQPRSHPSAVPANSAKLDHINTYGVLPEFYIDQPFTCRGCGKREIWRARDQKGYYEEARGHLDARAVECHACRTGAALRRPRERPIPKTFWAEFFGMTLDRYGVPWLINGGREQ